MQGIWETVKERKLGDRGRQGDRETERLKDREERGKGGGKGTKCYCVFNQKKIKLRFVHCLN